MRRCYILIYSQIWLLLLAVFRCYFIAAVAKNRGFRGEGRYPGYFLVNYQRKQRSGCASALHFRLTLMSSSALSADGRRSALVVVLRRCRQAEPRIHRLLPNRVAGRWKGRGVEGAHRDPADFRVAVSFPIERAAAIRAKVKANAITTVGFALIDLALAFDPHPLFRIGCAEMERVPVRRRHALQWHR